jgi:hypothetical protein
MAFPNSSKNPVLDKYLLTSSWNPASPCFRPVKYSTSAAAFSLKFYSITAIIAAISDSLKPSSPRI